MPNVDKECGVTGTLIQFCGKCKIIQTLWNRVKKSLVKLNIHVDYNEEYTVDIERACDLEEKRLVEIIEVI